MSKQFKPKWGDSPASTIRELMRDKGVSNRDLADAMPDRQFSVVSSLLHGSDDASSVMDEETAETLGEVLGGTKQFWMTRYDHWREWLTGGEA